jgi:hypothetical protein
MAQNPYLNVMVQSGYYDGACDYFNAKYNLWQMDPSGIKDRMSWKDTEVYDVFKKTGFRNCK